MVNSIDGILKDARNTIQVKLVSSSSVAVPTTTFSAVQIQCTDFDKPKGQCDGDKSLRKRGYTVNTAAAATSDCKHFQIRGFLNCVLLFINEVSITHTDAVWIDRPFLLM